MLARTAAREDCDANALGAHYPGAGGVNLPTTIVTTVPGGCCEPPSGLCVSTIPSLFSSFVGCDCTRTPKPDAFNVALASLCVWLVTSGTDEVVGPLATLSVIFVPGGCDDPGA